MKKIATLFLSALCLLGVAQIPNSDFENWNTSSFNTPAIWNFYGKITQVPGANGNFAVKMERLGGAPGAIIHGTPAGNQFWGGLPITSRPDSTVGNFNYSIAPNDTAWVLVIFKNQGNPISFDMAKITGNSGGNFIHLGFKNNFTSMLTPDSVVVGVTSTNPEDTLQPMGGFMIVDDLQFKDASGTVYPIANGDFENWNVFNDDEPLGWLTSNMSYAPYGILPVTKTNDAQSGSFAIRMETLIAPGGLASGYAICGSQNQGGPGPGFPVTQRDSSFNGYFKFFPQNGDTAMIGLMMYNQGVQVGWAFMEELNTVNTYTYFSIPIYYDFMFTGVPDSATIFLIPFRGGSNPHGNSVLFVDNLSLNYQSVSLKHKDNDFSKLLLYPNPANGSTTINYVIEKSDIVTISVFDVKGRLVEVVKQGDEQAGAHILNYNTESLTSGVYSVEIKTSAYTQTQKLVVQH